MIECLNGYRLKENEPTNYGDFTTPIGVPEIVKTGNDITVVSYGSTFNLCEQASDFGGDEYFLRINWCSNITSIRHQSHDCEFTEKTNRIIFIDEDVPGGATLVLNEVINKQKGYYHLDSQPITWLQKNTDLHMDPMEIIFEPNVDETADAIYNMMKESNPTKYPN